MVMLRSDTPFTPIRIRFYGADELALGLDTAWPEGLA